jgi:acyl transferase domain-containing protein
MPIANPNIDFKTAKIEVPTKTMDWVGRNGVRRASINSFGYGGSNAHAIIQNYRPRVRRQVANVLNPGTVGKRPYLVPLTTHSENAGKLWVSKLEKYLDEKDEISVTDLAYSLSSRRSMHRYRSFAIGYDRNSILKNLREPSPAQKWTQRFEQKPRLGFVFTGKFR